MRLIILLCLIAYVNAEDCNLSGIGPICSGVAYCQNGVCVPSNPCHFTGDGLECANDKSCQAYCGQGRNCVNAICQPHNTGYGKYCTDVDTNGNLFWTAGAIIPRFWFAQGDASLSVPYFFCQPLLHLNAPSVVRIDENAFVYSNLQTINVPNLQKIKSHAFIGSALTSINMTSLVEPYGTHHFAGTHLTGAITLPFTRINEATFLDITELTEVDAPFANYIGAGGFANTPNLETVYAKSCDKIWNYAFDTSGIQNLHLPVHTQFGLSIFNNNINSINIYRWYNGQQLNTFFANGGKLLDSNTPASELSGLSVSQLSEIPVNTIQEAFENKDGVVLDSSTTAAELIQKNIDSQKIKSAYQNKAGTCQ